MTTIDFEPKPNETGYDYANRLMIMTVGCLDCEHVWSGKGADVVAMFNTHQTQPGKTTHRQWREANCLCGWHSGSEYHEHAVVVLATIDHHLAMHAGLLP